MRFDRASGEPVPPRGAHPDASADGCLVEGATP